MALLLFGFALFGLGISLHQTVWYDGQWLALGAVPVVWVGLLYWGLMLVNAYFDEVK